MIDHAGSAGAIGGSSLFSEAIWPLRGAMLFVLTLVICLPEVPL
ncbi:MULTISPECIES: hypothetical protein [unclassified Bradyrhizobium]|nr:MULTISPECIES: hypothetical protein [unclassified Bradyrhizobium]